ncbi:hypothetical protein ACFSTC_40315 [Nonomuraea ferruginea]
MPKMLTAYITAAMTRSRGPMPQPQAARHREPEEQHGQHDQDDQIGGAAARGDRHRLRRAPAWNG